MTENTQDANQAEAPSTPAPEAPATDASAEAPAADVPFHEHPRFQEIVTEKNELKEQNDSLRAEFDELKANLSTQTSEPELEIPDPISDPKGYTDYIKTQIKHDAESARLAEEKANREAAAQIDKQLLSLKNDGKEFERDALIKFANEYNLTDMNKAYDLFSKVNSSGQDAAQKAADDHASSANIAAQNKANDPGKTPAPYSRTATRSFDQIAEQAKEKMGTN